MSTTQGHTGEPLEETHAAKEINQSNLQTIYPSAMTIEQRINNDELRQKARDSKRIKFPSFKIALYGSALAGLILSFAWGIEQLLKTGNTSLVFAAFAVGVILMFMFFAWVKYCNTILYSYGKSIIFFLGMYIFFLNAALVTWHLIGWHVHLTEYGQIAAIVGVHFITTLLSALLLLRK